MEDNHGDRRIFPKYCILRACSGVSKVGDRKLLSLGSIAENMVDGVLRFKSVCLPDCFAY